MIIFDDVKGSLAISRTARAAGMTVKELRQQIQGMIDSIWSREDPVTREMRQQLFPNGKPTPELFISCTAKNTQNRIDIVDVASWRHEKIHEKSLTAKT